MDIAQLREKLRKRDEKILHDAHLRFQRNAKKDARVMIGDYCVLATLEHVSPSRLPVPTIRGEHFQPKPRIFKEHWLPKANSSEWNVRPNFMKAFEETLIFMADPRADLRRRHDFFDRKRDKKR
jgi:hypothetical protein